MFKINVNNLKLKYVIGCYPEFENYPDKEDLAFDIISYCNQNNVTKIPKKYFEKKFGDDSMLLISELVKDGILKEEKSYYIIIDNPFK